MRYDLNKLKAALWHFHNITGMTVILLDKNFQGVFFRIPDEANAFCSLVQSVPEGKERCRCSDCEIFAKCTETKSPALHRCHAGLSDAIVPICKGTEVIGYVLFGQAASTSHPEQYPEVVLKSIADLGLNKNDVLHSLRNLICLSPEKFSSAIEIVNMLTKYILWEDLIQEETPEENFEKILEYIDRHLTEGLTVEDICKTFHISKNTLYQFFSERFGCGIKEYITSRRIAEAENLLRTTDLPVYEICEKCGIPNYSYFSAFFKREKNVTPLQYRKQWKTVNMNNQ